MAVFTDTTVYADRELTTSICSFTAGTARLREPTGGGYAIVGSGPDGGMIYGVTLNSLGSDCGGATEG